MPSVAQQDYIKIECLNRPIIKDAESLKRLAQALSRGTIYDVIISGWLRDNAPNQRSTSRILSCVNIREVYGALYADLVYADTLSSTMKIEVNQSEGTYDALEYIQKEYDKESGSIITSLPLITFAEISDSRILVSEAPVFDAVLATNDGFTYEIETDEDDIITSVKKSSVSVEEAKAVIDTDKVIILPEEKAQEFVGMMVM